MVLRIFILPAIALVGLSFVSSPVTAEEPGTQSSKATIEEEQKTVVPLPTTRHRGRLSTRDRWRGKPYLRNSDETLRSHALDKVLPPANPAFNGGASFHVLSQ